MIIELVSFSVPRRKKRELARTLASFIGPIEVQPGCLSCSLFQAYRTQDLLLLEARWQDQEGLIEHLQSDTYKKLLLLMEFSASAPSVEFFTVIETRGLDLVESARG